MISGYVRLYCDIRLCQVTFKMYLSSSKCTFFIKSVTKRKHILRGIDYLFTLVDVVTELLKVIKGAPW